MLTLIASLCFEASAYVKLAAALYGERAINNKPSTKLKGASKAHYMIRHILYAQHTHEDVLREIHSLYRFLRLHREDLI